MNKAYVGQRDEKGLRSITWDKHVYVATHHTTVLVLNDEEYASLVEAVDQDQAAESGDANTPWQDDPKTEERKVEAWLDT